MDTSEIRAELSLTQIEFEQALDAGMPHSELIKIYRKIKELQYQLTMAEVREREVNTLNAVRSTKYNLNFVYAF
jgi:hypothetical protein